jgi:hypothetical protein
MSLRESERAEGGVQGNCFIYLHSTGVLGPHRDRDGRYISFEGGYPA